MQSQARTLDAAGRLARMNRSPGVLLGYGAATFLTTDDARIHEIEGSIILLRSMANRHLASAHGCRDRKDAEGVRRHIKAVKTYRGQIRDLADRLDGVIARRARAAQLQAAE